MKDKLERVLTRMLEYDLKEALMSESSQLKKKFAFVIVMVSGFSVFACFIAVLVYKRFNKDDLEI